MSADNEDKYGSELMSTANNVKPSLEAILSLLDNGYKAYKDGQALFVKIVEFIMSSYMLVEQKLLF